MMKCSAGEADDTILIKSSEASNTRHLISKSVLKCSREEITAYPKDEQLKVLHAKMRLFLNFIMLIKIRVVEGEVGTLIHTI